MSQIITQQKLLADKNKLAALKMLQSISMQYAGNGVIGVTEQRKIG